MNINSTTFAHHVVDEKEMTQMVLESRLNWFKLKCTHPNMTAFHSIILLSVGAPLTPAGGSCCNL